jgi:hypothetical protein
LPQSLSEDGDRVFFDSSGVLSPLDTDGVQNVYEWEREGSGSCRAGAGVNGGCVFLLSGGMSDTDSWFVGASASGDDAFLVTRAQLSPSDQNEAYDLYDVRVGGVQPVSAPACSAAGCQGVPPGPPVFATPSSVTFEGVGNFPSSSSSSSSSSGSSGLSGETSLKNEMDNEKGSGKSKGKGKAKGRKRSKRKAKKARKGKGGGSGRGFAGGVWGGGVL